MRGAWSLATVLFGSSCVVGTVTAYDEELTEAVVLDDAIDQVQLDAGSGSVLVVFDPTAGTNSLRRTVRWSGEQPCLSSHFDEGVLDLADGCRDNWCVVEYELTLRDPAAVVASAGSGDIEVRGSSSPVWITVGSGSATFTDGAEAEIAAGSGSVQVTGSSGRVAVEAGSGTIDVRQATGPLYLSAGSGLITARDLSSVEVEAETGSGNIDLTFRVSPERVAGEAGSGNITVGVPSGEYQISTSTGSGNTEVSGLADGPEGGVIDLTTSSGNITLYAR